VGDRKTEFIFVISILEFMKWSCSNFLFFVVGRVNQVCQYLRSISILSYCVTENREQNRECGQASEWGRLWLSLVWRTNCITTETDRAWRDSLPASDCTDWIFLYVSLLLISQLPRNYTYRLSSG